MDENEIFEKAAERLGGTLKAYIYFIHAVRRGGLAALHANQRKLTEEEYGWFLIHAAPQWIIAACAIIDRGSGVDLWQK